MKNILVIDDDEAILEAFKLLFQEEGYNVTSSSKNGKDILTLIESSTPNLIVLDMLLSGNDGRLICKDLKSRESTKNIPIIMISAHPDAKKSAFDSGADDFIAKPFEINELLDRIKKLI
jgi:DNA-binding response OmpR family regulator